MTHSEENTPKRAQGAQASSREASCAYCGTTGKLTRDHIPPRNLFPTPSPGNLLTVPCCGICREGWSNHDEYLRAVIFAARNIPEDPEAKEIRDVIARSLAKPQKLRFAEFVLGSFVDVEVRTPAGLYLGLEPGFLFDPTRIDSVLQRLVRGLFFHEFGHPVPRTCQVDAGLDQFGARARRITTAGPGFSWPSIREYGGGLFTYTFATGEDPDKGSIWIGSFHRSVFFVGRTKEESHLDQ